MMKKNNKLIYITIILCILSFLILYINNNYNNILNYIIDKYTNRTDTIVQVDTLKITDTLTFYKEKPIPKYIEKVKTDTVFTSNGDSMFLKTENKIYKDSLCVQNDTAIVTNYISGINANLDSTKVQLKKTKEIITNTIEITKYIEKKKTFKDHFKVGVGVGYGYGFKNKDIEPFAGISVNYNF